jgi:hypothetical protein
MLGNLELCSGCVSGCKDCTIGSIAELKYHIGWRNMVYAKGDLKVLRKTTVL